MAIFECGLDSRNLRVLTEPPGLNCNSKKQHAAAEQNIPSQMEYCWVHLDEDSCAKTLRVQTASKVMTSDAKPMVTESMQERLKWICLKHTFSFRHFVWPCKV